MSLQNKARTLNESATKLHQPRAANVGLCRGVLLWAFVCMPGLGFGEASFDSLIVCSQITPDAERLACFDREMSQIRSKSAQPPLHAAPTAEQEFGLSSQQALSLEAGSNQAATLVKLRAHIVSVLQSAANRQIFVLDNTQTWQQIELDPDFAVRIGQEVTISKGALGSFWLAVDSHRATRVKRIRATRSG